MAHVGSRRELDGKLLQQLTTDMLHCGAGKPAAVVAQAALDLALGLWVISGSVTREMALEVVTAQIDSLFRERSN